MFIPKLTNNPPRISVFITWGRHLFQGSVLSMKSTRILHFSTDPGGAYWFSTWRCEAYLRAVLFRLNALEYCVFERAPGRFFCIRNIRESKTSTTNQRGLAGSVKSWVPNLKIKTINWSLRQNEWWKKYRKKTKIKLWIIFARYFSLQHKASTGAIKEKCFHKRKMFTYIRL